jgi:hypothetical protein
LSSIKLVRLHDAGRLPGSFDGREDGRRFRLRVVVPIEQILNQELGFASYTATDQTALTGGVSYWFLTKAKFDPDQTAV